MLGGCEGTSSDQTVMASPADSIGPYGMYLDLRNTVTMTGEIIKYACREAVTLEVSNRWGGTQDPSPLPPPPRRLQLVVIHSRDAFTRALFDIVSLSKT